VSEMTDLGSFDAEAGVSEGFDQNNPNDAFVSEVPEEPTATEAAIEAYKLKIGDEEVEVTLDELRNGYLRQRDYTRKTQEIAEQRTRLKQYETLALALERNPQAALEALREAYLGSDQQDTQDEYLDPVERELRELQAWREQQERAARQSALDREIESLSRQYEDFDADEVMNHALQHDIRDLNMAYRSWAFDKVRQEAAALKEAQKKQADAKATEAKRAASVVSSGQSRAAGSTVKATKTNSISEAYLAAKAELGIL